MFGFFGGQGRGDGLERVDLFQRQVAADGQGLAGGGGLVIVEVGEVGRRHDDVVALFCSLDSAGHSAPAHDGGAGGEAAF